VWNYKLLLNLLACGRRWLECEGRKKKQEEEEDYKNEEEKLQRGGN
jgi:hypothetical protein